MAQRGSDASAEEPVVGDPVRGQEPERFEITYAGHFDGDRAVLESVTTNAGNTAAFGAVTEAVFTLTAANLPAGQPDSA